MEKVNLIASFLAGVGSFFSPCVLPLIPAYISFISGVSLEEMQRSSLERKIFTRTTANSILFILGFSIVFIAMGASATFVGMFLLAKQAIFSKIAGVLVVIFGLHVAGILRIPFLNYEKKFQVKEKRFGLLGSLIIGFSFAFAWTPCIGPILGAILAIASTQETVWQGIYLLSLYSLGLAIPFFITGLAVNVFFRIFGAVKKHYRAIELVSGLLLVVVGILIFTNQLQRISGLISIG
ncbi:MAG: cytochrome c biogenesis protein CcdA [Candidatus Eisenbacteria bacterium]|nr:cytochrome c biogenesis protein CcdA [Candidatus Eisenbacteria bacterium]